jgi:adenosine deaminase
MDVYLHVCTQCDISDDFLAAIPKTDLHVHLDGSVRLNTLIGVYISVHGARVTRCVCTELAKKYDVPLPAYTEEEMYAEVFKTQYSSLSEYLKGFQYTTAGECAASSTRGC